MTHSLTLYEGFIYLSRFATVVLGATFCALLVLRAKHGWRDAVRAERLGFWTLLAYGANVTVFTALVLADTPPTFPNSMIYVGWIVTFVLGFQMLYHSRKQA